MRSWFLPLAEQNFSEFGMRWIKRLEARTDDWSLKTKLLESLEDAYPAPLSVLSDEDSNTVKDKFFEPQSLRGSFLQLDFWMSCKDC